MLRKKIELSEDCCYKPRPVTMAVATPGSVTNNRLTTAIHGVSHTQAELLAYLGDVGLNVVRCRADIASNDDVGLNVLKCRANIASNDDVGLNVVRCRADIASLRDVGLKCRQMSG